MAATSSGETRCTKQLMLDEVEALGRAVVRRRAERTAIAVGVRRVIHARHQRPEARRWIALLAVSDSEPSVRPWKRAEERDDVAAASCDSAPA